MTPFYFELPNELSKKISTAPPLFDFSWVTKIRFDTKNQACASKTLGDIITYTSLYRRGHFDPCVKFSRALMVLTSDFQLKPCHCCSLWKVLTSTWSRDYFEAPSATRTSQNHVFLT